MSNVTPSNPTVVNPNVNVPSSVTKKQTWIPYSPTTLEYQKLDLKPREFPEEYNRDTKTRLVKGVYKRKIPVIYRMRTDDDKEWLNWHEDREGKTPMQRKISFHVPNMGKKKIPVPNEDVEFDPETEEYRTVITGEKEYYDQFFIPFTQENLNELLEDINPYKTDFQLGHEGYRLFTVTKQEIQARDFNKVFESHLHNLISEFKPHRR